MIRPVAPCRIADMLRAQKRRHLSFHTPGHKRRGADITELSYSDNLLSPTGVLAQAELDTARILGADASFLLTDGSTCGVFSMLHALRAAGAHSVAVPVYAHRSVLCACEALGLRMVPVAQGRARALPLQPTEEAVAEALAKSDALLLTSPDYYGFFPPLARARELCTAAGKPLLVDGAHGAHLHGTPLYAGRYADMWVDGAHKSLPALTQGAVVSARAEWADLLACGVRTFRTTSPSYPILASVEYAVKYPRNAALEALAGGAKRAAGALQNDDWSKIVVPFGTLADEAQRSLERRGVYAEFNDGNYLMFYLSPAIKAAHVRRLVRLLRALPRGEVRDGRAFPGRRGKGTVWLPPAEAAGRTCARACGIFPPCMPVLTEGERVGDEAARVLAGARNTFGLRDGRICVYTEDE